MNVRGLYGILLLLMAVFAWGGCQPPKETPGPAPSTSSRAGAGVSSTSPSAAALATTTASPLAGDSGAKLTPLAAGAPLKIGITLHPYYSWTKNIVGDVTGVEVRPLLPGEVDAGDYQPNPEDIKKLTDLDAIVVNGIGHDDFIADMLKASGNTKAFVIHVNDATPLMKGNHGEAANSHTFISFTNAIQQTYAIARVLGELRPDAAEAFQKNASDYVGRLRKLKADAASKLSAAKIHRVVTVHDGYSYLCQELGIEVAGVVQPAHGLTPSAAELGAMVDLLKREKITVILTEESFPKKMLDVLAEAGPEKVYVISHVAAGEYRASEFEDVMKKNADTLVKALVTDAP